jgi:4-amino-4-deoxy-L-arabinose transferase-like glycosyltransferase
MARDTHGLPTTVATSKTMFWREWQFWALAALTAAIYFSRIADLPIRGEETRRAMVAVEILRSGDWIVPRQQGELFLSRPPVGSWPIAWLTTAFGGLSLVAVRLPTVLATLLTTLAVYIYARHFLSRLGALSSGLAYATCVQVLQLGRVAETEATFTFFLASALLFWHFAYSSSRPAWCTWCIPYALLAVATLVKSLQAPVYFCGAVGLFLLWEQDWRFAVSRAHLLGLCVFATIFGAWQVPFYLQCGWDAVRQVWASDVALRFADLSTARVVLHLATYPLQVLACLLPWSFLLPAYAWPQFRRSIGVAKPMIVFLAIAWFVALPTCWFIPNARPRYLMPLYPLAAPLIGLVVQRLHEADAAKILRLGWNWLAGGIVAAVLGGAIAVAAASWVCGVNIPEIAQTPAFAAGYLAAAAVVIAILVVNWNRWSASAATTNLLAIAAFLGLSVSGVAINSLIAQDTNVFHQIAQLKQRVPADKPLASFGCIPTIFSYYWGDPIALAGEHVPQKLADMPSCNFDYFCFACGPERRPKLPFPWRVEAVINCDRVVDGSPDALIIVGRRVEAVTALPDDTQTRR